MSNVDNNQVLIHCKLDALTHLQSLGLNYQESDGELDVIVDDVPYQVQGGYYQDPDEQLCEHYGLDYNLVNCIELV
mgnify:CR=1 FL=1